MKNSSNTQHVADSLRNIRESRSLDKLTVASHLGLNVKEYGKLERGSRALNLEHLCLLAELYKVRKSVVLDYGNPDRQDTNEAIEAALAQLELSTKWLKEVQEKIEVLQMKLNKKRSA